MRAATVFAGLLGVGLGAVQAADLQPGGGQEIATQDAGLYYSASGHRMGMLVVWDDQPGVVTRAYWLEPWRRRHYFPETGHKPRIGRRENLHARRIAAEPAEPFYRGWTTESAIDLPPVPERPLK